MRVGVIAAAIALGTANDTARAVAGVPTEVPRPWLPLAFSDNEYRMLGRRYDFGSRALPNQLVVGGVSLLAAPARLKVALDGKRFDVRVVSVEAGVTSARSMSRRVRAKAGPVDLTQEMEIGFDGFVRVDTAIEGGAEHRLTEVSLSLPVAGVVASSYSRYLDYDFNTQRADFADLSSSAGEVPLDVDLHMSFNPAIWIGNETVGVELVTQTNAERVLDQPERAHSLEGADGVVVLENRIVESTVGRTLERPLRFEFALFTTPARPTASHRPPISLVSSPRAGDRVDAFCEGELVEFHNWSMLPVEYPGLPAPVPTAGAARQYMQSVAAAHAKDRRFIPYSSFYFLHGEVPIVRQWVEGRPSPPARRSPYWRSDDGGAEGVLQPVYYDDGLLREGVIEHHRDAARRFALDGIYVDAAAPYENRALEHFGRRRTVSGDRLAYYPMFSHRKLLQDYWSSLKSVNDGFLIVHHAPRVPRFAAAYADIVVVGEDLHRLFVDESAAVGSRYVPDYDALDPRFMEAVAHRNDAVRYTLLPQIKKGTQVTPTEGRRLARRWTSSALRYAKHHGLGLWFARLDLDVARTFFSAPDRTC